MSTKFVTHWIIGVLATLIWFWGDKAGIPTAAITLAGAIVPGLIGHALGAPSLSSPLDYAPPKDSPIPGATTS